MTEPDYDYVLFIDEAGDDGLKKVKPIDPDGSSEWLIVAGLLVRAEDEAKCRVWLDEIRVDINATQSDSLHYRKLSPAKRIRAAQLLAAMDVRIFTLASNKRNMRGHHNPKAAAMGGRNWFYNWLVRMIMERVSSFCVENGLKRFQRIGRVKVVFSTRGGHSYTQTKAYWRLEAAKGKPFLSRRVVKWEAVNFNASDDAPHYMHAGLQLADICASAMYQAVDRTGKYFSPEPMQALSPRVARENGSWADFGVTLQPYLIDEIDLSPEQKRLFSFYGYIFKM
ncbi:DUF3800 domain-containing protein [Paracoccus sp. (in: a-proteobacteria)]|uniref:DUF3800 domain-containing protein n=1 Tax=Paracoccus sp. TaxID=267 RepID=UPI00289A8808|nr:DUF3800 domain-containing protein [Paracoccus sp. (in: a-proteobacteria)]